jgi:hypothetical protein
MIVRLLKHELEMSQHKADMIEFEAISWYLLAGLENLTKAKVMIVGIPAGYLNQAIPKKGTCVTAWTILFSPYPFLLIVSAFSSIESKSNEWHWFRLYKCIIVAKLFIPPRLKNYFSHKYLHYYIYIYRERERECVCVCVCVQILGTSSHIKTKCVQKHLICEL